MSIISNRVPFLLSAFFAVGILYFLPFPDSKVAFQRLESQLQPDTRALRLILKLHCDSLISESRTEEALSKILLPVQSPEAKRPCDLKVIESSLSRFHLETRWVYGILISTPDNKSLVEKSYSVQFPRPLILLPVILFFLSIYFEFAFWSLGLTVGSYLLLLFSLNLKHAVEETANTFSLMIGTDKTWLGLCLLVFFLKMVKYRKVSEHKMTSLTSVEVTLNRGLVGITGLWSPGFFTVFSVLLLPVKSTLRRLRGFFDGQVAVCALSLYFLASQDKPSWESLQSSILLPRYFSFTLFLLLFVTYATPRRKKQTAIWKLPDIKIYFFSILLEEILAFYFPVLRSIPTLARIALVLVISEMSLHSHSEWRKISRESALPIGAVITCSVLSILSTENGVTDMGLSLCQPNAHPTAFVFFTYLAGLFLGVLTGSFSITFFALIPHLTATQTLPIARAALLDGILAGNLLSPFSLFNIIPAVLFGIGFKEMIAFRAKQLWVPLLMGAAIYAVSAVNSVAILRPVTFIFLCLFAAAIKLHKSEWRIGRIWPWGPRYFRQ